MASGCCPLKELLADTQAVRAVLLHQGFHCHPPPPKRPNSPAALVIKVAYPGELCAVAVAVTALADIPQDKSRLTWRDIAHDADGTRAVVAAAIPPAPQQ
jgi:hypothetical protein